ncbi:toxin glutamine deamidase domain-containing protein [Kitasatospora sp. CM 4170]|uniref:toxin glutamine deamidase domain-containing protein n=1 Tax=Kitasatospora TaxID=2063 RepID=UPI0028B24562|nr:toxin glutamine deamidase domain-containing protein [Kitasatospora sp. CM 4170]WNM46425.1 toxin glutamine deamidase domain-containing protein [Kitasatospora sp. CM 4170]
MSRKLPEELAPVLARTGHRWPQADEDGLRKAAGLWREFGTEAERLGKRGGDSAKRITAENSGRAVDAFEAYWRAFSGSGKGHLDDAHSAAGLVAGAFDQAARAVDSCKADIVAALNELAAELKQAEEQAARAKAAAAQVAAATGGGDAGGGIFGGLRRGANAVAEGLRQTASETVAEAAAALAVEGARLKIGGLLDELGRAMKDGLSGALKEPAVVAVLRLGPGGGPGGVRPASFTGPGGAFDPVAAGLPAVLGEPGVLGAGGGAGLAVVLGKDGRPLVGEDGRPVVGVPGLAVKLDEAGRPVLDEHGDPVILRPDGTPVTDADGLLVVKGADGRPVVGVEDLTVKLDEQGQPLLGKDGRPVVLGKDGKEVAGLPLADPAGGGRGGHPLDGRPGGPLADGPGAVLPGTPGAPVAPGSVVRGAGPDDVVIMPAPDGDGHGRPGGPGGGPEQADDGGRGPVRTGPVNGGGDWSPPAHPEAPSRPAGPAHHGGDGGSGSGSGGNGSVAAGWSGPADGDYHLAPAGPAPHGGGGGGGGGPVTVRTDSVLAPPAPPAAPAWSPSGPEAPTGGGGPGGPAPGGSSYSAPSYGGTFSVPGGGSGPVATGPVGPGPLVGGHPGYGAGPAAAGHGPAPFGNGIGPGAAAGAAGPAGLVAVPGGPVTGSAPAPGAAGTPGAPGAAAPGQHAQTEPRPGAGTGGPRATTGAPHPVPAPGPLVVPPPAAPPVAGPGPGAARPELHPGDHRRRPDGSPAEGETGLAWAAVPVATAHAMALQLALRARRGTTADEPVARLRTIADSRPYGLPGGLGPVDPEHQREIERRAPRDGEGLALRHPDPAAGGWAEVVNDGGHREPGRPNNSLEIALSAVETFTGRPTCAAPRIPTEGDAGERGGRDRAERELGAPFRDLGDGGPAFGRLADELKRAGHGSQAVLLTLDGFGRPHAWNAVNHKDAVTYLDHQVGRRGGAPLHDAVGGLWAIALDPDGRPLDLTGRRSGALPAPAPAAAPEPVASTAP